MICQFHEANANRERRYSPLKKLSSLCRQSRRLLRGIVTFCSAKGVHFDPFYAEQGAKIVTHPNVFALIIAMPTLLVRAQDNSLESSFDKIVRPFFRVYCLSCHDGDNMISGVRVDQLSPKLEERYLKLWKHIQRQVEEGAMPPKDEAKQPYIDERQAMDQWITEALAIARARSGPKNDNARRLTVAQYRNT